jgi:hypothetical protein
MLIGPITLDGCVTELSKKGLPEQLEDVPLVTQITIYFQHDGATSHYTRLVMQHLSDTFHNQWISHGSTTNWPPRSLGLTLLHFCLWG